MKFHLLLATLLLTAFCLADQGMTSPTHAENVGKIVFSNQEIKFRKEDSSKFRNSFNLGEPLFGRMYFKQCMGMTPLYHTQTTHVLQPGGYRDGSWEVLLYVDGVSQNKKFQNFADGQSSDKVVNNWTTKQLNLAPDDPSVLEPHISDPWIEVAAALKPGTYDIRVVFQATQGQYKSKPMAEGSFKLTVGANSDFAAGSFPQSTYTGSDLNTIRDAMKGALVGPVAKSFSDILDVSVTSDWKHGRYTDSLVEYRKIQGTVLWADSNGDGVSRYTSYSFIQTKQGSSWSALKFNAFVNGGPEGNYKP